MVEVNARDQSGLLARLALAVHQLGFQIHSAHIATYGERAIDTFYVTNAAARKLSRSEIEALRVGLAAAAGKTERTTRAA